MSRYRMSDGTVVDTSKATQSWDEDTYWDGQNHISRATGTQWNHETLYRSRKGRYYIESHSDWQGSRDSAEWVSREEAARWLLVNKVEGKEFPEDLQGLVEQVVE
jgi:hypothetical protein